MRALYRIVPGVIALITVLLSSGLIRAQPGGDDGRRVVVLSDLHMGEGRNAAGEWSPYEDFRWVDEFELFLVALGSETEVATDLVLNGDIFELVQSAAGDCVYDERGLGCSEAEAMSRLERVMAAHRREIEALGAFARVGNNRLVLVPGDHDAALLFPSLGMEVVAAFRASSGRVQLATEGFWRSEDGLVHVEHGHQLDTRAERFDGWPAPFVARSGRRHVGRPWGEQVAQSLFDEQEPGFPIIDNLADVSAGVRYAFSVMGVTDTGSLAPQVLRYLLFRMSWQQFRMDLDRGDVEAPVWRLEEVRAEGPGFLVDSLPDDDRFKPLAVRALDDGRLSGLMAALGDEDLSMLCDHRAALRRARRRFERILTQFDPTGPPVTECPRAMETSGPRYEYFWQSRDRLFGRHLEMVQGDASPVAVFVHGHTHLADYRQGNFARVEVGRAYVVDGFSPVRDAVSPVVINGGAWQRTVTPVQLERFMRADGATDEQAFRQLQPEQLPPCYSFVEIEPYGERPGPPAVRYWRQQENGDWGMAGRCGRGLGD